MNIQDIFNKLNNSSLNFRGYWNSSTLPDTGVYGYGSVFLIQNDFMVGSEKYFENSFILNTFGVWQQLPNIETVLNILTEKIENEKGEPLGLATLDANGNVPLAQRATSIIRFDTPSNQWLWVHNLNTFPKIEVIVSNSVVNSKITYLDNDSLTVEFSSPQSGVILI